MKETYKIHIKCSNCGYKTSHPDNMLEIEKGTSIAHKLIHAECPECGCRTLEHNN